MKKQLFLAIAASAALVGCVKNEPIAKDNGSPAPITFDAPVVNVPTKANEIVGNYPADKDFAVFALYFNTSETNTNGTYTTFDQGTMYMNDVTCTANQTPTPDYWQPNVTYYWPKNGTLTFGAYAPSSVNATWDATGFHFTDFSVNDTPANQIDLLYSERVYNKTKTDMRTAETKNPYQGITIPFKHALSSIVFKAKTDINYSIDNYTITITDITVDNVVSKGTFAQGLQNDDDTIDNDNENPAWTPSTTDSDRKSYNILTGGNVSLNTTATPVGGEIVDAGTDGIRRSDLIVIPQSLNTEGKHVKVTVKYTIQHGENTPIPQVAEVDLGQNFQTGESGSATNVTSWEIGKRYIYTITVGLDKIYFNPTVAPWTDVNVNSSNPYDI